MLCAAAPAQADVPLGLQVGYAFRPNVGVGVVDDRFHGAAGSIIVHAPPVLWGFSGRLELDVLAWPGQTVASQPILAAIVVPSLTYAFDDSGPTATASLGPAVGVIVRDNTSLALGAQAGLMVRLPVVEGFDVAARINVATVSPDVGLFATAMVGVTVSPDVLIARALAGDGPEAIAREVAPTLLPPEAHDDDNDNDGDDNNLSVP